MQRTTRKYRRLLGARLEAARRSAMLTQVALAKKIGMSQPNISEIEAGRRQPSIGTVVKLAKALRVGVTYIINGRGF